MRWKKNPEGKEGKKIQNVPNHPPNSICHPANTKLGNLFLNQRRFQQEELAMAPEPAKGRGIMDLGRLGKIS